MASRRSMAIGLASTGTTTWPTSTDSARTSSSSGGSPNAVVSASPSRRYPTAPYSRATVSGVAASAWSLGRSWSRSTTGSLVSWERRPRTTSCDVTSREMSRAGNDTPRSVASVRMGATAASSVVPVGHDGACARRRAHSTRVLAEGLMRPPAALPRGLSHPRAPCAMPLLPQGHHALFDCKLVDVISRPSFDDQPLDLFGDDEELEERLASPVSGVRASGAAHRPVQLRLVGVRVDLVRLPAGRHDVGLGGVVRLACSDCRAGAPAAGPGPLTPPR